MIRKVLIPFSIAVSLFGQGIAFIVTIFYLIYRFLIPETKEYRFLSLFLRNVFEKKKAKNYLGISLLILIFGANFFLSPFSGRPDLKNTSIAALAASDNFTSPEKAITTETTYQKPTQGWLSQEYSWYHQAIDIGTVLGENVYPVSKGKVYLVEYTNWGYGHFIVIEHDNGYKSLYAHLQEINVKVGDKVEKATLLGDVGITGRTSGPHLHLEIYNDKEGNINPTEVVPDLVSQIGLGQ